MAYQLATAFVKVEAHAGGLHSVFGTIESGLHNIIHGIGELSPLLGLASGITTVALAFHEFVHAASNALEAESRLESIIRATGEVAHITAEEVLAMSNALQNKGIFSNTDITRATTSLLQLRAITRETFPEIIKLSEDVAAAGFGSVEAAARTLGRAMADPARGLYRLRSIGIVFTQEEHKKIIALTKTNQLLAAQRIILNKVRDSVGGTNEALAKTPFGQLKQVKNLFENIAEELGKKIYPAIVDIAQWSLKLTRPIAKVLGFVFDINQALGNWPVKIALVGAMTYGIAKAFAYTQFYTALIYKDIIKIGIYGARSLTSFFSPMASSLTVVPGLIANIGLAWNALVTQIVTGEILSGVLIPVLLIGVAIVAIAAAVYGIYKYLSQFPAFVEAVASYWDAASIIVENIWNNIKEIGEIIFYIGSDLVNTFAPWLKEIPIIKTLLEQGIVPAVVSIIDTLTDGMLVVGAIVKAIAIQVEDLHHNIRVITSGKGTFSLHSLPKDFRDELGFMRRELKKRQDERAKKKTESALRSSDINGPLDIKGGLSGLQDAWKNVQDAILAKESPAERTAKGVDTLNGTADGILDELMAMNSKLRTGEVATV